MKVGNRRSTDITVTLVLAALLLLPVYGFAQTVESDTQGSRDLSRLQTIDELYLESQISVQILKAQIMSDSLEHQLLGLAAMEDQLAAGTLDPHNREAFDALTHVLEQGVFSVARSGNQVPYDYNPIVRHKAARIMGLVGTEEARKKLVQTVELDPDASVRTQALYALADIGEDPDGSVTFAIARMLRSENLRQTPNDNAVFAALVAVERINGNADSTMHSMVVDVLVDVAVGRGFNRLIRSKALQVLSLM